MTHIQQRRGTFAAWTLANPILMDGEAGHERDTGRWKLGDGVTPYIDLPYKSGVDSVAGKTGVVTLDVADVSGAAPIASPTFTGAPTAPTPSASEDSTRLATTEWTKDQDAAVTQWVTTDVLNRVQPTVLLDAGSTLSYNTMTNAGWYVMDETAPNAPVAEVCYLEVRSYGNNTEQTARVVSTGDKYIRTRVAATWGPWRVAEGVWKDYTPVWGNITVGSGGSVSGRYTEIGDTIHFWAYFKFGVGSAVGNNPTVTVPVQAGPKARTTLDAFMQDAGSNFIRGWGVLGAESSLASVYGLGGPGGVGGASVISATTPFAWAPPDDMFVVGTYERV